LIFAYGKEQRVLVLNPFLQWRALPAFGGVNWSGEYAEDQVLKWEDVDWQRVRVGLRFGARLALPSPLFWFVSELIGAKCGTEGLFANYPMALDAANKTLFVGCRLPARLVVLDTTSGRIVTSLPAVGGISDGRFHNCACCRDQAGLSPGSRERKFLVAGKSALLG
jgi:hypothetical protein